MTTPESQTVTLFGGRSVSVIKADGTTETLTVRQLPLRDYEAAFKLSDDEQCLVALICGKDKSWLYGATPEAAITPESYEELLAAAQEVNAKGFFAYAERRQTTMAKRLNSLGADVVKAAAAAAAGISSTPQPRLRPMPG